MIIPSRVHVVGAGLAGLAAATRLAGMGHAVTVHEAAGFAGGRCRSYHDQILDRRIDNGNHLVLSGNRSILSYLDDIGAADSLTEPTEAAFPFLDLGTGERWTVRPNAGWFPWWVFSDARRVPGSGARDYLKAMSLAWAGREASVADVLGKNKDQFSRFWEPISVAVLNTAADEGAASLFWPVVRETFGRGGAACLPRMAKQGLSESFVDPALLTLGNYGAEVRFNRRLRSLSFDGDRVRGLDFGNEGIDLNEGDAVVLAVPPHAAAELVPGLEPPLESRAIVNGHFRLDQRWDGAPFLGLIGGVCEWLFVRGDVVSATVSAADALAGKPADSIALDMWADLDRAMGLGGAPLPVHRIVKERRATFAQTPNQAAFRPNVDTRWINLALAGDWIDTGLPATLEGAVRSGHMAARKTTEKLLNNKR